MSNQCPKCGRELKLVPAGISKTGKPYGAFFSCTDPTKTCRYTAPVNATPAAAQSMSFVQTKTNEQKDFEKSMGMIRHGLALKAIDAGMELNPVTDKWISRWADYIMTGKLLTTPTAATTPVQTTEQPFFSEEPQDEEIRVDEIPF